MGGWVGGGDELRKGGRDKKKARREKLSCRRKKGRILELRRNWVVRDHQLRSLKVMKRNQGARNEEARERMEDFLG